MGMKEKMGAFEEKFCREPLFGCHLIAGLSGGADSMSLVYFLAVHGAEYGWTVEAVHINHCLRGAESDRDEQRVRAFCRAMNLPLTVHREDIAGLVAKTRQSEEVCGREVRYRRFLGAAERARQMGKAPVIVTAHTLSDDLETTLLHLVRGCSLDGLCGIPQERMLEGDIPLVRPMLKISREEVETYCAENHLPFVTDSSNLSDAYARNRLRLEVLPQMKKLNPSLEETYLRMRESLSADREYLSGETEKLLKNAEMAGEWDSGILAQAPEALRFRAEAEILRRQGILVSTRHIRQLDAVVREQRKALAIGNTRFQIRGGQLMAERDNRYVVQPVSLPAEKAGKCLISFTEQDRDGKVLQIWQKKLYFQTISAEEYFEQRKIYKNLLYFAVDYDTIKASVVIRTRAPGDFLRLPGNGGRKTLKKIFQEAHLSRKERETRLLLAAGSEVIWLEGFGVGEAFRPGNQTKRVLIARTERMEKI